MSGLSLLQLFPKVEELLEDMQAIAATGNIDLPQVALATCQSVLAACMQRPIECEMNVWFLEKPDASCNFLQPALERCYGQKVSETLHDALVELSRSLEPNNDFHAAAIYRQWAKSCWPDYSGGSVEQHSPELVIKIEETNIHMGTSGNEDHTPQLPVAENAVDEVMEDNTEEPDDLAEEQTNTQDSLKPVEVKVSVEDDDVIKSMTQTHESGLLTKAVDVIYMDPSQLIGDQSADLVTLNPDFDPESQELLESSSDWAFNSPMPVLPERRFYCIFCHDPEQMVIPEYLSSLPESYPSHTRLLMHIKQVHLRSTVGRKPSKDLPKMKCPLCSYESAISRYILKHVFSVHKIRYFTGADYFSDKIMPKHDPNNEFMCLICETKEGGFIKEPGNPIVIFEDYRQLKRHLETDHVEEGPDEKLISCPVCSFKTYTSVDHVERLASDLIKHIENKHEISYWRRKANVVIIPPAAVKKKKPPKEVKVKRPRGRPRKIRHDELAQTGADSIAEMNQSENTAVEGEAAPDEGTAAPEGTAAAEGMAAPEGTAAPEGMAEQPEGTAEQPEPNISSPQKSSQKVVQQQQDCLIKDAVKGKGLRVLITKSDMDKASVHMNTNESKRLLKESAKCTSQAGVAKFGLAPKSKEIEVNNIKEKQSPHDKASEAILSKHNQNTLAVQTVTSDRVTRTKTGSVKARFIVAEIFGKKPKIKAQAKTVDETHKLDTNVVSESEVELGTSSRDTLDSIPLETRKKLKPSKESDPNTQKTSQLEQSKLGEELTTCTVVNECPSVAECQNEDLEDIFEEPVEVTMEEDEEDNDDGITPDEIKIEENIESQETGDLQDHPAAESGEQTDDLENNNSDEQVFLTSHTNGDEDLQDKGLSAEGKPQEEVLNIEIKREGEVLNSKGQPQGQEPNSSLAEEGTGAEKIVHKRPGRPRRKHKCPRCRKSFCNLRFLENHRQTAHPDASNFLCVHCGKALKHRRSLVAHTWTKHGIRMDDVKLYTCEVCGKEETSTAMTKHVEQHEKEKARNCRLCNKQLHNFTAQRIHMNTHRDSVGRYLCPHCDYVNKKVSKVLIHLNRHHETSDYKCELCSYFCATEEQLKAHFELKHPGGVRIHFCYTCSKQFSNRHTYQSHMFLKHNHYLPGTKVVNCVQCSYQTCTSAQLEKHIRIHHGAQPQCSLCKKIFPNKHVLNKHLVAEHKDLTYMCTHCDHVSHTAQFLARHLLQKHGVHTEPPQKKPDGRKSRFEKSFSSDDVLPLFGCPLCPFVHSDMKTVYSHLDKVHGVQEHDVSMETEETSQLIEEEEDTKELVVSVDDDTGTLNTSDLGSLGLASESIPTDATNTSLMVLSDAALQSQLPYDIQVEFVNPQDLPANESDYVVITTD